MKQKSEFPYIETVTGRLFPFLSPSPADVDIKDIAFSLANQCRFNGHVPFFSVAEHSVAVAARLPAHLQLAGLLHDAAEAYLSDIPSPIKCYLPDYKILEDRVQLAIDEKFEVDTHLPEIKNADKDATSTEAFYLLKSKGLTWAPLGFKPEAKWEPRCLNPLDSYKLFMTWYVDLTKARSPDGALQLV